MIQPLCKEILPKRVNALNQQFYPTVAVNLNVLPHSLPSPTELETNFLALNIDPGINRSLLFTLIPEYVWESAFALRFDLIRGTFRRGCDS